MAILGGDIHDPDNPLTLDTLEDLKNTLLGITTGGEYYIAFPKVYDGPKVIDLRSRGWNPISFSLFYDIDGANGDLYIHIYFNGWTILGLSISDQTFFNFRAQSKANDGSCYMYIYDLTMKNCYFLSSTSDVFAFRHERVLYYGNGRLTFKNCKFSAVLDNQTSSTNKCAEFIYGANYASAITIDTCSFNIYFTNSSSSARILIIDAADTTTDAQLINSIVSLNSKRIMIDQPTSNNLINNMKMRFCKIIGNIKHYDSGPSHLIQIINAKQSVYNVVDLVFRTTRNYGNGVTMRISFRSGVNIVNTDNIKTADNQTPTIEGDYKTLCTTAQMIDKDWLNEHFFICGDPPSD